MPNRAFRYETFNPFVFAEIPDRVRVLDVGCAIGILGKRLREEKGCVVVEIEADTGMVEEARKNLDEVFVVDLDAQIPRNVGTFDVIVCADILEHLKNPLAVLRDLTPHISPLGFVLVSVPNIAFVKTRFDLLLGRFDYTPQGIMDETHLRFFTMKTLKEFLQKTELEIDFIRGYNVTTKRYFFLKILGRLLPTVFAIQFLARVKRNDPMEQGAGRRAYSSGFKGRGSGRETGRIVVAVFCSCLFRVRVLEKRPVGENRGTTGGYNLGFQHALNQGANYVMSLALDTVLDPDCLDVLVSVMESSPQIGAVRPALFYSDEPHKIQMYGSSVNLRPGWGSHDYRDTTDIATLSVTRDAQYLDGGSMLVRADAFCQCGGFDENLFMYFEDCDLSLRIQEAGYRTVAVRDARAWHYHRENRKGLAYPYEIFYLARNRFYLVRKHAGASAWIRLAGDMLWRFPLQLAYYLYRRRPDLAPAYITGIVDGVLGKMGKTRWVE